MSAGARAERLAALHGICFEEAWSAASFTHLLAMPSVLCLVAGVRASALDGLVLARVIGTDAEVLTLAVDPARRGRGLGTGLLAGGLAVAASAGARKVFLEVAEDNAPAMALYRRAGFDVRGRRPDYYARADGAKIAACNFGRDIAPGDQSAGVVAPGLELWRVPPVALGAVSAVGANGYSSGSGSGE